MSRWRKGKRDRVLKRYYERFFKNKIENLYCNHFRLNTIKVYGPYIRKEDGRKLLGLVSSKRNRIYKLYAKVKLEVKVGIVLNKNETVDHIDENPFNDKMRNLQLLDRASNLKKSARRAVVTALYPCLWCKNPVNISKAQRVTRRKGKNWTILF